MKNLLKERIMILYPIKIIRWMLRFPAPKTQNNCKIQYWDVKKSSNQIAMR